MGSEEDLRKAFGLALRDLRAGITQEELAHRSGLHPTYISLLERGRKSPSLRAIQRIALALKTTPSQLVKQAEDYASRASTSQTPG